MPANEKQKFAGCRRCVCVAAVFTSTVAAIIGFEVASMAGVKPSTKLSHVNIDVMKDFVGLQMSGHLENFKGGMASHLHVDKISCDVYMTCKQNHQHGHIRFVGPITQAGSEISADIAVHAENFKQLKHDLQTAATDQCGTCSFDLKVKLFSFIPIPVTVTRALSDLQPSSDKEDKKADDADSNSTGAEAQKVSCDGLASLHGAPDRELGGTYCMRVPGWMADLSRKTGAGKVSMTLGSTQLELTAPRMNGTWIVRTEQITIPDVISSQVMEINASTSFQGFMASPAIALLADGLQHGNSSMSLRPLREDTLGQLIGSHDFQSDVSPHGRQLNTDVDGLTQYASQQLWNDLRDWCDGREYRYEYGWGHHACGYYGECRKWKPHGKTRWEPCLRFLDGWRGIAGDLATEALSGYLLDKLSSGMLTLPSARLPAMKTWEGHSVVQNYASGQPQHAEVSVGGDNFKLSLDMDELIGDDWTSFHNVKIKATITMSQTLSDWLQVPTELRQGGKHYERTQATFAVDNKDGTGQASLNANGNEMLSMSWKYTAGQPEAPRCNDGHWSYHPLKGTMTLNLRQTTSVDAEFDTLWRDFPFLDGGDGQSYSVWKSFTLKDRIGKTTMEVSGSGNKVFECAPKKSLIPGQILTVAFDRPSSIEMIKTAEAKAAAESTQQEANGTAGLSLCVLVTLMAGMALAA